MRIPSDTQRHVVLGKTGSGKTQAALWFLSHRNFHEMPWIIYDFKSEPSIAAIPGTQELDLKHVPRPDGHRQGGVYVVRPLPGEEGAVEEQMWEIWRHGDMGVYVDEGYMLGRQNKGFRALLTQGRSKRIPMIVLSQRPVWMDRFVFSEAEFYQVFHLQHRKDRRTVEEFVPADLDLKLPRYHSLYYDAEEDRPIVLRPVPDIETIHSTFRRRLTRAA